MRVRVRHVVQACGDAGVHVRSVVFPMSSSLRSCRRPAVSPRLFKLAPIAFAAFAAIGVPGAVKAQADVANRLALASTLPQVVITASRMPQRIDESIADVTVLEHDQIDRADGRTLAELLATQAGIQLSANGGLGKTSALFIRGSAARHVLLLIDGVRYGSATSGEPDYANLPIAEIERIEIVRGPMSALYGSEAAGGVVQVFTRRPVRGEGLRTHARATVGSHGHAQAGAGLSFAGDGLSGGIHVLHTEDRGYSATNEKVPFGNFNPDRDGFRQDAARLQLRKELAADWSVQGQWLQIDGKTRYDDGLGADSQARLGTQVASFQLDGRFLTNWRSQVRLSRSVSDYDTLVTAPFSGYDLGNIQTDQRTLGWENIITLPLGSLVAIAERIEQRVAKPVTDFDQTRRTIHAVSVGYHVNVGEHRVQTNLRRDQNSQFGAQTTGSVGYGISFTPALQGQLQIGTSFVAPTFNDLYWPVYGNPLLQPEKGRHAEAGLRHVEGDRQLGATVFVNRIRGYITEGSSPVNLPYTQSTGLTLHGENRWGVLRLNGSVDFLRPINDSDGSANQGNLLPRRAPRSFKVSADVDRGAWSYGAGLQAYSHRFDDNANTERLAGYATLDAHTEWKVSPDWQLNARLNNLADRKYETALGFNQPGREVFVGVRYSPR